MKLRLPGIKQANYLREVNRKYIPNKVIQSANLQTDHFPLLEGKFNDKNESHIFLCKDYSCKKPVFTTEDLIMLLKN